MDIDARLSANLGFLWTDLDLLSAITAAATAGFSAVEFHQPFETPPDQVASALGEHGMTLVSLNTGVGNAAAGELGLAAVPGREREARALIDEAVDYAGLTNARFVSVVAGITGRSTEAELTYRRNLTYACERAAVADCRVLIEPLNTSAVPDYHLVDLEAGVATIEAVESDRLSLMADTFHVLTMTGSLDGVASALDHKIGRAHV